MRVVEPHEFKSVKHPKKKRPARVGFRIAIVLVLLSYLAASLLRPLPAVTASTSSLSEVPKKDVSIAWPTYGQAAVGAVGYGILGSQGEVTPLPTASVAKVMTALAVLKKKPLTVGQQGPEITITQEDVDDYARTVAMDGSNVPVAVGEEISQYQALQALLLPSANNMASTLARWAYGSEPEYLRFVNNFAKSLGMENTYFDDSSGYSAKTVSTAQDLVKLAVSAMDNPVIAEIAAQPDATIPVAGKIFNVNLLLGKDGIVGVKTGNTEQAGGCFMAAAERHVGGKRVVAVSVIMGAPNLYTALKDSVPLVNSILDGFQSVTVAKTGQKVGQYSTPWGESANLIAKTEVSGVQWAAAGGKSSVHINNDITAPQPAGQIVGSIEAQFGRDVARSEVTIDESIAEPPLLWRLKPAFL